VELVARAFRPGARRPVDSCGAWSSCYCTGWKLPATQLRALVLQQRIARAVVHEDGAR